MITYERKSGCGCGGHKSSGAPCACGGDASFWGGEYVRPRFFAGQLLTEEDLDLLMEYVAAKNRLHNRSFFGEGVVCGFEVGCPPCGGGSVLVRPGHALDCCGNDIVLACERELDVNALIRDLRADGYDCVDPCAEPETPVKNGRATSEEKKSDYEVEVLPLRRRYALYALYTEQHTDPVAPYATDEPCGPDGCEPSRTREGLRFELRCDTGRGKPDDFVVRVLGCLDDLRELRVWARRMRIWSYLAGPIKSALSMSRGVSASPFEDADAAAMKASMMRLGEFAATAAEEGEVEGAEGGERPDVRALLDDVRAATMATARLHTLAQEEREAMFERFESLSADVEGAPETLRIVTERLEPLIDEELPDTFERQAARALLTEAPHAADPGIPLEERHSLRNYLAMEGTPVSAELMRSFSYNFAELKEWLLCRLDESDFLTDCTLRRDVERIDVSQPSEEERLSILKTYTSGRALVYALVRYLYGCLCAALLPPCRACEDPAVLLATIEVEDCDVVSVCNLERTIPLTGTALAYWLPVQHLARLLDLVCCELPRRLPKYLPEPARPIEPRPVPREPTEELIETSSVAMRIAEAEARHRPLFAAEAGIRAAMSPLEGLLETAGMPRTMTSRIAKAFEDVAPIADIRKLDLGAIRPAPPRTISPDELAGVLRSEAARPVVLDALRETVPEIVREPAREAAATIAATAAVEAVESVALSRLRKIEERMKDVTALKRDVTTLRKRNEELARKNTQLERRVAKLGGS